MELGLEIKRLRLEKDLTLRDLEKIAKVDHTYIWMIENGKLKSPPTPSVIGRIAKALGVEEELIQKRAIEQAKDEQSRLGILETEREHAEKAVAQANTNLKLINASAKAVVRQKWRSAIFYLVEVDYFFAA